MDNRNDGIVPRISKKVSNVFMKRHLHEDAWEKLIVDLDGLSEAELKLVLSLVENTKTVNEEDKKAVALNSNR